MLFGKKERQTETLIQDHITVVGEVVASTQQMIDAYCNDKKKFKKLADRVTEGESAADQVRRNIEMTLYEGAFMPLQRGDYARLVEAVDKVANQCEAVAEFLVLTRPELDDNTRGSLREIMDATVRCYSNIPSMFEKFHKGRVVMELAHQVEEEERAVDLLFEETVRELFKSDMDLARKLHVKLLLDRTAAITNRVEDASDRFSVMVQSRP
jgi:uncharacterized protein